MSSQVVFMMGISQQQQLEAMPDGMAKRILLKIINAPKAPVEKLKEEYKNIEAGYLKDHNLTELPR